MEAINGVMEFRPTRAQRLGLRLFPSSYCDMPDFPEERIAGIVGMHRPVQRDGLVNHTTIEFSFIDRLRILISGKVKVTTKTATEGVIGVHVTASSVSVQPPKPLALE